MKRLRVIAAASAVCLLLSACDTLNLNRPALLTPPRADGDDAQILSLIEQSAGGDYTLIYPAMGDYQSAVIFRDLDGDGEDEAAAVYRGADNTPCVLLADRTKDGYRTVGESAVTGSVIQRIDFCDLDQDGCEELITCCSDAASPLLTLSVTQVNDTVRRTDLPAACTDYLSGDYDGDGVQDLLLISLSSSASPASARLVGYQNGAFHEKAACPMDDGVSELSRLSFGMIDSSVSGAVIDARSAAGEYTTQIVYYDSKTRTLLNPLYIYAGYQNTRRPTDMMSADIDRDGMMEIPICSLADYTPEEDAGSVCRKVAWNSYSPSGMTLIFKKAAFLCEKLDFLFQIDDAHLGAVTARYTGENSVTLYSWVQQGDRPRRGGELVTIRRYDKESYDSSRVIEAVLSETGTAVYTYTVSQSEDGPGYTPDEVAGSFVLLG